MARMFSHLYTSLSSRCCSSFFAAICLSYNSSILRLCSTLWLNSLLESCILTWRSVSCFFLSLMLSSNVFCSSSFECVRLYFPISKRFFFLSFGESGASLDFDKCAVSATASAPATASGGVIVRSRCRHMMMSLILTLNG